ncbi:MAG: serine hydrolase [Pseudomonadota bacterium]
MLAKLCSRSIGLLLFAFCTSVHAQPDTFGKIADIVEPAMERAVDEGALGAAVVIVADGEVAFQSAKGFAKANKSEPVDAETTAFRFASLGKSVVAMAALQMASTGQLDLDENIAAYLGEDAPAMPFGPITMRHLLSHTSGIDAEYAGDAARSPGETVSLAELVPAQIPAQRFNPGSIYIYSNHGYALAGRVMEKVSGRSFSELMQDTIFTPLGMSGSRFVQGYDPARVAQSTRDGSPVLPSFTNVLPADGWIGTMPDLGRYMIGQLALREDSPLINAGLHNQAFAHTTDYPREGLGWEIRQWGEHRVLSHTGGVDGFSSIMVLVPDSDFGIAIALNSRRGDLRSDILDTVRETYFSTPRTKAPNLAELENGLTAQDIAGTYLSENRNHGRLRWVHRLGLSGGILNVSEDDGVIDVEGIRYAHSGANTEDLGDWQRGYRIRFVRDDEGRTLALEGRDAYRRLHLLNTPTAVIIALIAGVLASIARIAAYPFRKRGAGTQTYGELLLMVSSLCFVTGLALVFLSMQIVGDISFGLHPLYHAGQVALVAAAGIMLTLGFVLSLQLKISAFMFLLTFVQSIALVSALQTGLIGLPWA